MRRASNTPFSSPPKGSECPGPSFPCTYSCRGSDIPLVLLGHHHHVHAPRPGAGSGVARRVPERYRSPTSRISLPPALPSRPRCALGATDSQPAANESLFHDSGFAALAASGIRGRVCRAHASCTWLSANENSTVAKPSAAQTARLGRWWRVMRRVMIVDDDAAMRLDRARLEDASHGRSSFRRGLSQSDARPEGPDSVAVGDAETLADRRPTAEIQCARIHLQALRPRHLCRRSRLAHRASAGTGCLRIAAARAVCLVH